MMELEFDRAHKGYIFCSLVAQRFVQKVYFCKWFPFTGWNSCLPMELFDAPVEIVVKKESLEIQRTLIEEAKKCNVLLLWLDCDLEGENIAYEVTKVCTEANPRLDVYRARFSGKKCTFSMYLHSLIPNFNASSS